MLIFEPTGAAGYSFWVRSTSRKAGPRNQKSSKRLCPSGCYIWIPQVGEIVFHVRREGGGWIVLGDRQIGAATDKSSALDLATGMAHAINAAGGNARVVVEDRPESPR